VAKCLAVSSEFTTFAGYFLETYQYEVVQMSAFVGFCGGDDVGVTGLGAVASL
jgi:hypothetical protein